MTRTIKTVARVLLPTVLTAAVLVVTQQSASASIAPGCTSAEPTSLSGTVESYPHAYPVNARIGLALEDASHQGLKLDGTPSSGGYVWTQWVNSDLPNYGDPTKTAPTAWGPVCVASNVAYAFMEVYPSIKLTDGTRQTDKTYFGEAADETDPVGAPGGSYTFDMRVPEDQTTSTPTDYTNKTGYVNGYITCGTACNNQVIPAADLLMRAFPNDGGTACGIQGFSANYDQLGPSSDPSKGDYYRINGLAGGQCGAASQNYNVIVYCMNSFCGPGVNGTVKKERLVGITTGVGLGVNFQF